MKKTRFLSLALTGTLCVSLLAGCGGSGDGGGAAQTPDAANTSAVQENTGSAFKLGGTGPLTGDAAIYGLAAQRGAQIAVDEIKEAGGDIQFALKYEDDVNVPETAVNAYNALKEWGMQISLGSVTSQPGVSTSALAFEDRIFTMTPSGSSPMSSAARTTSTRCASPTPTRAWPLPSTSPTRIWVRRSLSSGKMTMCIPPASRSSL